VPKRTPAEDRRSRPTEPAIPDESIRSTGLSAASVLAAHLRASDPYLAESQQLSHTGSFGWKPSTGEIIWSDETFRIFQYDRATVPTVERVLQRVHPEDRARVQETIDRAAQTGKDVDFEHRLLMPDGSVRRVHIVARALSASASERLSSATSTRPPSRRVRIATRFTAVASVRPSRQRAQSRSTA
jgi:PAS domain-containing protein